MAEVHVLAKPHQLLIPGINLELRKQRPRSCIKILIEIFYFPAVLLKSIDLFIVLAQTIL